MARPDSSLASELFAAFPKDVSLAGYLTLCTAFCTLIH
jgi:hypothetical protein